MYTEMVLRVILIFSILYSKDALPHANTIILKRKTIPQM